MARLFFSYSHRDEDLRAELEVHLAALKRQGLIDVWHDRRIVAGEEIDTKISRHLEEADIILLLVSPYFIASDYCYQNEMRRAMERHDAGTSRVIPVILHPCDWQTLPFGRLKATPTDGKPISKFPNVHDAFLEVAKAIRGAIEQLTGQRPHPSAATSAGTRDAVRERTRVVDPPRSSNLRAKRKFTDHEKDRFLADGFDYLANYFENSLAELEKRNVAIKTDFRRVDKNRFTAAIYDDGDEANRCTIWFNDRRDFPGGIAYSAGNNIGKNSYNENLTVEDDGYEIFFMRMGAAFGAVKEKGLTFEGAAEQYWGKLVEPLQ